MTALILIPGLVVVTLTIGLALTVLILGPRRSRYDINAATRDAQARREQSAPSTFDQPLSPEEKTL